MLFALIKFLASGRELGNWPETGFAEISAQAIFDELSLHTTGLDSVA
jgi:hypothetical protein